MKTFSHKVQKKMEHDAKMGVWHCVELSDIPAFASWLTDDFHGWRGQSPDAGEVLRIHRHGLTLTVKYNGRRTSCGRHIMGLYLTFLCFYKGGNHHE